MRREFRPNPDPIRVVKLRTGEAPPPKRCDHYDERGRCTSYETKWKRLEDWPYGGYFCGRHWRAA